MAIRRALLLAVLLGLAACARPPAPPPVPAAVLPPPPPALVDPDTACLRELEEARAAFRPVAEFGTPGSCGVGNPVEISSGTLAWNRPGLLSCPMARSVVQFEARVVQPAAWRHFRQPVARLHHAGTYDCRQKRNATTAAAGGSRGGRLSEHAKGRAIDITAFELADGTMVSVKRHWRGAGAMSGFLHEVAKASCGTFNVVLTPNHDRYHRDHLHLDIGPHRLCGY